MKNVEDRLNSRLIRYPVTDAAPDIRLLSALAESGVVVENTADDWRIPALISAASVDESLHALITAESAHGERRVLVILDQSSTAGSDWSLLAAGASDVVRDDGAVPLGRAIRCRLERWGDVDALAASEQVRDLVIGASPAWLRVIRAVVEAAAFTSVPILITGESGTGKEMIANLVHALDRRPYKGALVLADCSAIVPELSGSEFFGHEKGSYTGAHQSRDGAFALADKGTLFLDEIGELPGPLQAQLLRAVQEKSYKRVGSNVWRETEFRLVAATNRDLLADVETGRFRRDLYYRIAAWVIHLPPLRERPGDILPLALHFLRQFRPELEPIELDDAVTAFLLAREYPGNVRDLRQLCGRIAYRHAADGRITAGDIPPEERIGADDVADWNGGAFRKAVHRALALGVGLKQIGRSAEEIAEEIAIEQADGNLQRAARLLGVTDRALQIRKQTRKAAGAG